ncbi:transcription factor HES-1-A [Parasteatoda tepidariorum]|uniref:Protein deadpan n=1 Tax=Parasteatoda tepidariorum TaxID=114398 RepID=A0A2L2YJ89_PARTP|nr:transcription factor HES-1-A [Parasteatoda tepidariorum]
MPAERPPSKASENRRATKPIMEKRRRARINQCLSELKTLILDALNKDPSRHSKLEKADILEMTVRHLQNIQRQQMATAISTDSSVLNKFKAGFNECATEVTRYVNRIEGVDPGLRQRLVSHLSNCLTTMNTASHFQQQQHPSNLTFNSSLPGMLQSLSVQIPGGLGIMPANRSSSGDINNNSSPSAQGGKMFTGLSVIPSRLPNGEFAFLLPSQSIPSSGSMSFHLPSVSASSSLPSSSGPDRNSQSSWPPTSPSSKRSASPDAMSEDNIVLSPTCSDAGSDVFIEPYHHSKHHHAHMQPFKEMVLAPVPRPVHRSSPMKDRNSQLMLRHPENVESENVWRPW